MSRELRLTYRALLKNPGDTLTMLAVADLLEEEGNESLARAYRWAAENRKWPVKLTTKRPPDWFHEEYEGNDAPVSARLPDYIWNAVRDDCDPYDFGTVSKVFKIIARGLDRVDANRLGSTAE
jgi:hypothetical protein